MNKNLIVDFKGHRVMLKDKTIWLTNTQNNILEIIYNNKNRVVTYEEIVKEIYSTECDNSLISLIRRHITSLRKKINRYINIKTVRGVGYIIEEG